MEHFSKEIQTFEIKILHNSIIYYLLFDFLVFLTSFSILPVYSCQKILKIFVLFYCIDPRFYQRILQNYVFFSKKFEIFEIQNFIVYYFFFIFLAFLTSFFFYFSFPNLCKNYEIFCSVFMQGLEILSTNSRNFQKFF